MYLARNTHNIDLCAPQDNVDNGNSVALNITEESTANATSDNISLAMYTLPKKKKNMK